MNAYNDISKKIFELDTKLAELDQAKDNYRKELVKEAVEYIMNAQS